jgi:hypothetical protein
MDLLTKSIMIVVVIVIIIALLYYLIVHFGITTQVSEAEAISLVTSDIKNSHPGAVINITNVSPSQYPGSWHIIMSVIYNATSPCPSFYTYSFDYPKFGFVYGVRTIIQAIA